MHDWKLKCSNYYSHDARLPSSLLAYGNMRQFWIVNNSLLQVQVDINEMNLYGSYSYKRRGKSDLEFVPLAGEAAGPPASGGPCGLGGAADRSPSLTGRFPSSFFSVFSRMVWQRRRHSKVRIKYSPSYPLSGGASSIGGGHVGLCVRCWMYAQEKITISIL